MLEDLTKGELFGAAASPITVGYYASQHPDAGIRVVNAYESEPKLAWNIAVGMRKADQPLVDAVNRCSPPVSRWNRGGDIRALRRGAPYSLTT